VLVRLIYSVRRVYPRRGDSIEIAVDEGDLAVSVVLTATTTVVPDKPTSEALGRIASGSEPSEGLKEYGSTISLQLAAAMVRVYELVRWRSNAAGPDHPYVFRTVEFSLDDGASWTRLPMPTRASLLRSAALDLETDLQSQVAHLVAASTSEPVAHHLLREALEVAPTNTRSAIVIGVAAVETGFKNLVETLVPDAAWLISKVASPPLARMLKDYLPELPAVLSFDGVVHPPPKYARSLVVAAVEERNLVAHTGASAITRAVLAETLACFGDLLYLFDYYSGSEWALEHISDSFQSALGS
jgi:hypothetical protein